MNFKLSKDKKKFLGRWVLFNGIAWLIGIIVAFILGYFVVNLFYPQENNLILGFCPGIVIGYSQWFVIKKYFKISVWWIFASAIGMGIPDVIAVILFELTGNEISIVGIVPIDLAIRLFIGGLITGLLQFNTLKPFTPKYIFWIFVNALAWGIALFGAIIGGAILGLITGIFLLRSIIFPNQEDLKKNE